MHTANTAAGLKPLDNFKMRIQRTFGMGRISQEQFNDVKVHIEAIRKILDVSKHTKNNNEEVV